MEEILRCMRGRTRGKETFFEFDAVRSNSSIPKGIVTDFSNLVLITHSK